MFDHLKGHSLLSLPHIQNTGYQFAPSLINAWRSGREWRVHHGPQAAGLTWGQAKVHSSHLLALALISVYTWFVRRPQGTHQAQPHWIAADHHLFQTPPDIGSSEWTEASKHAGWRLLRGVVSGWTSHYTSPSVGWYWLLVVTTDVWSILEYSRRVRHAI